MHFSEPHILQSFLSVHVNRLHQVFMCLLFQGQIINLAFHTCLKGEKKKPQDAQKNPKNYTINAHKIQQLFTSGVDTLFLREVGCSAPETS